MPIHGGLKGSSDLVAGANEGELHVNAEFWQGSHELHEFHETGIGRLCLRCESSNASNANLKEQRICGGIIHLCGTGWF
jgi:hypothetical protein